MQCPAGTKLTHVKGDTHVCKPDAPVCSGVGKLKSGEEIWKKASNIWKTKDGKNTYCSVQCPAGTKLTHVKGDTHVCKPEPVNCQLLRDKYDLIPGRSWGSMPADVRKIWSANKCDAKVKTVDCKFLASHYGIVADKTWGKAPKHVQQHWAKLECGGPATKECRGVGKLKSGDQVWKKAPNMWKTKDGKNVYCSVQCAAGTKLTNVNGDRHVCKPIEAANCKGELKRTPRRVEKAVNERGSFKVEDDSIVFYGARKCFTSKEFKAGSTVKCDNSTFTDPLFGVTKACFVRKK